MTQFAVQPLPPPLSGLETAEQERGRELLLGNQRPGFFEAARLAAGSQWSTSWLVTQFRNGGYTYDPTFVLDEPLIRELGKDLPPQYWEAFTDAHSLQHAQAIRDNMLGVWRDRQRLRSLGWGGVALELGAAILDPGALALDIAITAGTGGLAGPAVVASRLNRVQRFIRGGLIAASSQVPIQAYISSQDPEQGVNETLWAAAGSLMLGGGLSAIRRTQAAPSLKNHAEVRGFKAPEVQIPTIKIAPASDPIGTAQSAIGEASGARVEVSPGAIGNYLLQNESAMRAASEIATIPDQYPKLFTATEAQLYGGWNKYRGVRIVNDPDLGARISDDGTLLLGRKYTRASVEARRSMVEFEYVKRLAMAELLDAGNVPRQAAIHRIEQKFGLNWADAEAVYEGISDELTDFARINEVTIDIRRTQAATELRRAADAAMLIDAQNSIAQDAMGAASRSGIRADRIAEIDATILKPPGRVYFDKAWGKAAQDAAVDDAIRIAGLDPVADAAEIAALRGLAPDLALARLQTANPHLHVQETGAIPLSAQNLGDWDTTNVTDAPAAWTWLRPSLAARIGATDSPAIRMTGNLLVQDALVKADGTAQNLAGSEWVRQRYGAALFRLDQETAPYWKKYVERTKPHFWERGRVYNEFNENIGRLMRVDPSLLPDSLEKSASMPYRQMFGDVLEIAQRHGVPGLENVVRDPAYMPTLWNYKRLNKLIAAEGFDKVASRLVAPAIRAKAQDVEQALRTALAKNLTATAQSIDDTVEAAFNHVARGYLNVVHHLDKFSDYARHKIHLSLDEGTLTDVLKAGGLTDHRAIDEIVSAFVKKRPAAGTPERAMKRMPMDYDYFSPDFGVTVADLLENNVEAVARSYARAMLGSAAEHRMLQTVQARFKTAGPIDSWEKLKSFLAVDAAQNGMREGQIASAMDRLDIAHRALVGKPINPRTGLSEALRTIRAYNHIRLSGQFGIAQANEVGNVVGEGGWRAAMQQMPILRRIMHAASNGTMPDTLLDDIAAANGIGTDNLVHMVTSRFDRDMQELAPASAVGRTLDNVAHKANYVSFMTPLTVAQKRTTAAVMAQRWFNQAWSGRRPSKARLALYGMTESEWDALAPLLKKHSRYEENVLGKRLVHLDFDALHADNPTAASRLVTALDRTTNRIIQENDLGNLPGIATSDWFKVMFQFKTFAIGAWEKHLLSRAQMRDFPAFMGFMWNLAVAGLTYTAAVHVTTLGKPDREKRLKEALDPYQIGAAAFQRTSSASLLPNFIDTARQLTHYDPIFKERYTGTSVGFLDFNSNPTVSVVNSAARALGTTAVAPFRDDVTISQATANQWSQLLPFRRVLGISNMIDYTTSQFPKQR